MHLHYSYRDNHYVFEVIRLCFAMLKISRGFYWRTKGETSLQWYAFAEALCWIAFAIAPYLSHEL